MEPRTDPRIDALRAAIPAPLSGLLDPAGDARRRQLVASLAVPIPPDALLPALLVLAHDPEAQVRTRAALSLSEQPRNLIEAMLRGSGDPVLLGVAGAYFYETGDDVLTLVVVTNAATPDETIATMARTAPARLSELIASNQVRLIRHPDIIRQLYFNERVPMAVVSKMIETAVRNDVDLGHLPGAEAIKASIMGTAARAEGAPPQAAEAVVEQEAEATAESTEATRLETVAGLELDDDEFMRLLFDAAHDDGEASVAAAAAEEVEEERPDKNLWSLVRNMSVAQKVRLALVGNMAARAILIKDAKKMVSMAVLDSPRLTEREVQDFARNKAIGDDVIRRIASNREWTRNLALQRVLVTHPKCPPQKSLEFVKNLSLRDLKDVSIDRDVPAFVARQAKALLAQREKRTR